MNEPKLVLLNDSENIAESNKENLPILSKAKFILQTDKKGNKFYKSSAPDRKILELSADSAEPDLNQEYDVGIILDTEPANPMKGKYIGRLLNVRKLSEEEIKALDIAASEMEGTVRELTGIEYEAKQLSGMSKSERNGISTDDPLLREYIEAEKKSEAAIQEIMRNQSDIMTQFIDWREENVWKAMKTYKSYIVEKEKIILKKRIIQKKIADNKKQPDGIVQKYLTQLEKDLNKNAAEIEALKMSSPEAYFAINLSTLKKYQRCLKTQSKDGNKELAQTPYVEKIMQEIDDNFRLNMPILIHGHLGSGKTESAMHYAANVLHKKALIISGSKQMSMSELYGHQTLSIDKMPQEELDEFEKEVSDKMSKWLKEHPEFENNEDEKNRAQERFLQIYLTKFKSGTISKFYLGPIYEAMEQGRPLIIDEVNAIPHEILISLNHILTRKAGETLIVQQDGGREIKIQEGYGVIMTGNINEGDERYIDRCNLDPAFLNRLKIINYEYLPQDYEGSLKNGQKKELYQLLLSMIADRRGNITAPADTLEKMWRLAQGASLSQRLFAGKEVSGGYYFNRAGQTPANIILEQNVASIRSLERIISRWQLDGCVYELDHYIWNEFINNTTSQVDKAYLYQLFKDKYGFFRGSGWNQTPDYNNLNNLNIESRKNFATLPNNVNPIKFFSVREVIEAAFGEGPDRVELPQIYTNK